MIFNSNDWILENVFSLWTIFCGFWLKFFNRDVNTYSPRRDEQLQEKLLFSGINYQFKFDLSFWDRSWTFTEKKLGLSKLHLTCSEENLDEKMFFLISYIFTYLFGLWRKHNRKFGQKLYSGFSKMPFTCAEEIFEPSDFLWNPSFAYFFPEFSRKYPAVLSKPNFTCPDESMRNQLVNRNDLILENLFDK